jgi:rhodanese-related sulfurtransferase
VWRNSIRDAGISAAALVGGMDAWKAAYPVEPIPEAANAA